MVRAAELAQACGLKWSGANAEIRGICHDSRRVAPGDLFAAWAGEHFDGRQYIADAMARGAAAVLAPPPAGEELTWLEAEDPRSLLGPLAAQIYGAPPLQLIGVTGTNGKSTVIAVVSSILEAAGLPAARIGTLGCHFQDQAYEVGGRTTPEASDLFRALIAVAKDGARAAAIEVSSHALEQGRVDGLSFDLGVFTNLSRDHLDFHGDMEAYFRAKCGLFERLAASTDSRPVHSVVCLADEWGCRLAAQLPDALTYSQTRGGVRVSQATLDLEGIRARVETPRGALDLRSPLIGRYNLENLLAAVAVAEALELPPAAIVEGVAAQRPITGRLEPVRVSEDQRFPALVDYAHTPAALEASLEAVAELGDFKVALVFGCGGKRDRGKRPMMGEVAGRLAAVPVLTSDNPRDEDPQQILQQVEAGVRASGNTQAILQADRRLAIEAAVDCAVAGSERGERWLVLVAGKGHEATQDLGHRVVPFLDHEELARALSARPMSSSTEACRG